MSYAPRRALPSAAIALSLTALAACGSSSSSSTPASDNGKVVKLQMLTGFTGPDRPSYQALVDNWNSAHPNIQVTMDVQPWAAIGQKLPQSWATGQGPDLATPSFDPNAIFQYIKTNSVEPLDSAVGTGDAKVEVSTFPKTVTSAFTVDGKLYAVPANLATLVLYYNKALLQKAGVTAPPATVDELVTDAKKLTLPAGSSTPTQYGISLADHETIQMWPILQWLGGGDIVDAKGCATIDSPQSVAALKTWADLVQKDHVSPVGQTGADADTLFSSKKAAFEINGPWAAAGYRKAGIDLGIAPVPSGSAGPVTLASTVPLMVAKSSKHKAEAEQFLAYWTGKTAQLAFSKGGFPPVRTDLASQVTGDAKEFAAALPNARLYLAGLPTGSKVDSDVYVPLIGKITRGSDVAGAASAAAKQINGITGCKA
ncbi:carbohydrate ABC transporter substrate-binding protein (CUT1 family) [Motilibacter rhizosphaerae]|uniref:Carbohydrate ABC transporter substrate-binding protein (CUT1 family) n=1 Tax=Motilibacter rhizosphaerae TaxID=598652 RepID=A0A4Q7NNY1_9ACTN|nr:ABC transporter substrate-binding protein [Motilibacter rhizosphaerae]RZS86873.1 carbohydrate ABC transporter substrate-binding protein (CUT1 family) [Motilibacter rhizosphaerae]